MNTHYCISPELFISLQEQNGRVSGIYIQKIVHAGVRFTSIPISVVELIDRRIPNMVSAPMRLLVKEEERINGKDTVVVHKASTKLRGKYVLILLSYLQEDYRDEDHVILTDGEWANIMNILRTSKSKKSDETVK